MKLTYHGQHGPEVTVGNPGVVEPVFMPAGESVEVPDELAHALLRDQPGTFSTGTTPQKSAPKEAWQSYRADQGHDVEGLTKEELIELPDTPKGN